MWFFKKISLRRSQVRKSITGERFSKISRLVDTASLISIFLCLLFTALCIAAISFQNYNNLIQIAIIVILVSLAAAVYIYHYQGRIIKNHVQALKLVGLFICLLAATRVGVILSGRTYWATATSVAAAIIMTISYNQRFALGMSLFYCLLAFLAIGAVSSKEYQLTGINLILTTIAAVYIFCFSLKEIRTRMKMMKVSALAAVIVLVTAITLSYLDLLGENPKTTFIISVAGYHAGAVFLVGLLIQSLLPLIEKIVGVSTSMTLLDYSDANQPLLKRLAMEAPGTFSHSLLIGSIAEAAAEAIGRNGLLCRVGAYYHDIGKINKPSYFVENQMGLKSRHKEISPTMSHLIIVGHVKDGIEMAKEYGLPSVLWQFIETHHGTTLVEHFYHEAKKQKTKSSVRLADKNAKQKVPSESEFRYPGPKPRTKEAAIVLLVDTVEGAVRSLPEITPVRIEAVVHNMAMRRLQDGQFDECSLSLRELSKIEASISKALAAHYHGRIAYPTAPDAPDRSQSQTVEQKNDSLDSARDK
jgi:putative nucleotidyltransferase with HDIG domain